MLANVVQTGIGNHSDDFDLLPFGLGGDLNLLPDGFAVAEELPGETPAHDSDAWRTTIIVPEERPTLLQVDSDSLEESRHYQRNINLGQPGIGLAGANIFLPCPPSQRHLGNAGGFNPGTLRHSSRQFLVVIHPIEVLIASWFRVQGRVQNAAWLVAELDATQLRKS